MPVIEHKCPGCGASMVFGADSGMLSCLYCGKNEKVSNIPDALTRQVFTDSDRTKEYYCNSCGAVIMTDEYTSATRCSFCEAPVALGDRLTGKLAPAKIIPFTVSKEEAVKAFRKWCKRGIFTPAGFKPGRRIKKLTGVYVPYWLYDLHSDVEVYAQGKKVDTYTSGDYEYTDTEHYDVYRKLSLDYVKVPVDAAEKMKDELMDQLEPFPYDRLEEFRTPYLSGYIAEKYTYDEEELFPRVKEKINDYIDDYIEGTMLQYDSVSYNDIRVRTERLRADYVLLPVWVVLYDYNQSEYTFVMNGQTGKVAGKPPVSKVKVTAWFTGIAGILFLGLQQLTAYLLGGDLPW